MIQYESPRNLYLNVSSAAHVFNINRRTEGLKEGIVTSQLIFRMLILDTWDKALRVEFSLLRVDFCPLGVDSVSLGVNFWSLGNDIGLSRLDFVLIIKVM